MEEYEVIITLLRTLLYLIPFGKWVKVKWRKRKKQTTERSKKSRKAQKRRHAKRKERTR